jgi:hypothetical protein
MQKAVDQIHIFHTWHSTRLTAFVYCGASRHLFCFSKTLGTQTRFNLLPALFVSLFRGKEFVAICLPLFSTRGVFADENVLHYAVTFLRARTLYFVGTFACHPKSRVA